MENLLLSYARDLDDAYAGYEFSIWSKEQLLTYFNEALCLIAAQCPEMFTELKVVKLDPCSNFLPNCDCLRVVEVVGQSDKHGNNIRPLQQRLTKATTWTGNARSTNKPLAKELTAFELVDTATGLVRMYPNNLDPTKDYYVVVRCVTEPKNYSLGDEPPDERCAFMAIARHWVLYNAKMIDGEFSSGLSTAAREHRQMFFDLLREMMTAESKFEQKLKVRQTLRA